MIVVVQCTTYADILSRVYGSPAFHSVSRTLCFMPLTTFVQLCGSFPTSATSHSCKNTLVPTSCLRGSTWCFCWVNNCVRFYPLKLLPMLIPFWRQFSLQQEWLLFPVHHWLDTPAPVTATTMYAYSSYLVFLNLKVTTKIFKGCRQLRFMLFSFLHILGCLQVLISYSCP